MPPDWGVKLPAGGAIKLIRKRAGQGAWKQHASKSRSRINGETQVREAGTRPLWLVVLGSGLKPREQVRRDWIGSEEARSPRQRRGQAGHQSRTQTWEWGGGLVPIKARLRAIIRATPEQPTEPKVDQIGLAR